MIMFINTISHQRSFFQLHIVHEQGLLLAGHILCNLVLRLIVVFRTQVGSNKTLVLCDNLALLGIQLEGVLLQSAPPVCGCNVLLPGSLISAMRAQRQQCLLSDLVYDDFHGH